MLLKYFHLNQNPTMTPNEHQEYGKFPFCLDHTEQPKKYLKVNTSGWLENFSQTNSYKFTTSSFKSSK